MDLDELLRSARPDIDGPTPEVVDDHRARLGQAMGPGQPARHRRFGSGRPLAIALGAAAALVIVGLVFAGWFVDRGDRRTTIADVGSTTTLDVTPSTTEPTPSPGSSVSTSSSVEGENGSELGSGPAPDRPQAEGAIGGLDPADAICGVSLPDGVEILPGSVDAIEPLAPELVGQLAQRVTRGPIAVEYRWPAIAPPISAAEEVAVPRWPESSQPVFGDDSVRLFLARDPAIEVEREPVEGVAELGPEPYAGALADDGSDLWVIDWLSEELLRQPDPVAVIDGPCRRLAIDVYDGDELVDRFGWDLLADPAVGFPVVSLDPLIVETIQGVEPPGEAVACDGGPDFPNERGVGTGESFPTPEGALLDYLGQPTDTSFATSFIEYVEPDGSRVYVDAFAGEVIGALIVRVAPGEDGRWALATWEHSGC